MFPSYINFTLSKFLSITNNKDSDSVYMENESIEGNSHINLNSLNKNKEKEKEEEEKINKCSLSNNYSNSFYSSYISESSLLSLLGREYNDNDEKSDLLYSFNESIGKSIYSFFSSELQKNKKKELIFKITYSPKHSLFTKAEVDNNLDEDDVKEKEES